MDFGWRSEARDTLIKINERGQPVSILVKDGSYTSLAKFEYDAVGHLKARSTKVNGNKVEDLLLKYDSAKRLNGNKHLRCHEQCTFCQHRLGV